MKISGNLFKVSQCRSQEKGGNPFETISLAVNLSASKKDFLAVRYREPYPLVTFL